MLPKGFQIKSHLFKTPNPGFSCLSGYRGVRFPSMGTCAPRSAEVELDWRKPLQIYDVCGTALRPAAKVRRPAPACEGDPSRWEAGGDPAAGDSSPSSAVVVGKRGGLAGHGPGGGGPLLCICVHVPRGQGPARPRLEGACPVSQSWVPPLPRYLRRTRGV